MHVANAFDQCITKTKLLELTTQQPNKLRDYLLGKNSDLFRKPGDEKHGGLLSQRIIFAELEFGFLLHLYSFSSNMDLLLSTWTKVIREYI